MQLVSRRFKLRVVATSIHVWRFLSFCVILKRRQCACWARVKGIHSATSILPLEFSQTGGDVRDVGRRLSERSDSDRERAGGVWRHLKSLVRPQAINWVCLYSEDRSLRSSDVKIHFLYLLLTTWNDYIALVQSGYALLFSVPLPREGRGSGGWGAGGREWRHFRP